MGKTPLTSTRYFGRLLPVLVCAALTVCASPATAEDESLAHHVPADVGLFLELRHADDLLIPLTEPQAWLTVAELAGQPARLEDTEEWRQRVQQTVNMSPVEAIRKLFSQRVAFVAEGLRQSYDAVVLCRPPGDPMALIHGWQARPLPTATSTSVYRLPNNVGLALHDDLLVFGDNNAAGMFPTALRLLETGSPITLADDPTYKRLLARVPQDPDGVFFARLRGPAATTVPTTSRPAALNLPGPLRGSSNVLLALHRAGRLLHFSAVGDQGDRPVSPASAPAPQTALRDLVAGLPERTLLAWAGNVEYSTLPEAIGALPERSVLRLAFDLQKRAGTVQRLTETLSPATCVALGVVWPEKRPQAGPPVPACAVLVTTSKPEVVNEEWGTLFHSTLAIYKLLSLKVGPVHEPLQLQSITLEGTPAEQLDLSPLIGWDPRETPFGEVELAWAMDGNVLIIASHSDWLRQIIAARRGRAPRLAGVLELLPPSPAGECDNIFVAQSGPIADLGAIWLEYLQQTIPVVLRQDWWRAWQPGGRNPKLGIQVISDTEHKRLRVESITPGTPADGILKPGDEVFGCNDRRFATSQPVTEIARGLASRPDARWIDLYIERERVVRVCRVPLPFVDPVQVLRRLVAIGQIVQRVVYSDGVPDADGPRGSLTLELRGDPKPLFAFEAPAPSTKPAPTSPVSSPVPASTNQASLH